MATKRCQIGRNNPEMTGHRYLWQNTEIQNMASGWVSTNLANQRKQSTFNWQIRLRTWTWAKILRAGGWTAQVQPSTLPTDQPTISLPLHNQLLLKRIKQRERRIHLRTLMSSQELLLHGVWETIMFLQGSGLVVFEKKKKLSRTFPAELIYTCWLVSARDQYWPQDWPHDWPHDWPYNWPHDRPHDWS